MRMYGASSCRPQIIEIALIPYRSAGVDSTESPYPPAAIAPLWADNAFRSAGSQSDLQGLRAMEFAPVADRSAHPEQATDDCLPGAAKSFWTVESDRPGTHQSGE